MFFKILCALLGVFLLTGNSYAQEEEAVPLRQTPEVVNTYCAISTKLREAQKNETQVFIGIVDQYNILHLSLAENGFWSITVENASGISCVYFMGQGGTPLIEKDEKENTDFKGNIGRRINGVYIYK
jgi:hypothetical protein